MELPTDTSSRQPSQVPDDIAVHLAALLDQREICQHADDAGQDMGVRSDAGAPDLPEHEQRAPAVARVRSWHSSLSGDEAPLDSWDAHEMPL
jgi:hypothetical protein